MYSSSSSLLECARRTPFVFLYFLGFVFCFVFFFSFFFFFSFTESFHCVGCTAPLTWCIYCFHQFTVWNRVLKEEGGGLFLFFSFKHEKFGGNSSPFGLCVLHDHLSPVYQSLTEHTWHKHKTVHILAKIVVTHCLWSSVKFVAVRLAWREAADPQLSRASSCCFADEWSFS